MPNRNSRNPRKSGSRARTENTSGRGRSKDSRNADKPKSPRDSKGFSSSRSSRSSRESNDSNTSRRSTGSKGPRGSGRSSRSERFDDSKKFSSPSRRADDKRGPRNSRDTKSTSKFNADSSSGNEPKKRGERKFPKGPSFGLPFKRSYDKKRRGSDDSTSSGKAFGRSERDDERIERRFSKKARGTRDSRTSEEGTTAPAQTDKIRLNKYIANSGVCSRREADELITMGLISVNGKTITELGYKVNPGDEVRYENKVLKAEKPVYILMNKPKGYLTTTDDPQERNTVMHIIGSAVKERIYPVGRLDRNTTGLLLLTNDGDLADKLMHPSYDVKKIYKVELNRPLTQGDFQTILEGVRLEEGRAVVDDLAIISEDNKTVGIEIHIGWNRVVRRIFETLGYEVTRLDRSVYAGLDKKDLGRGQWRFLTKEEIVRLKHYR